MKAKTFRELGLIALKRLNVPVEYEVKTAEVMIFTTTFKTASRVYKKALDVYTELKRLIEILEEGAVPEDVLVAEVVSFAKTYYGPAFKRKGIVNKDTALAWFDEINKSYDPETQTFSGQIEKRRRLSMRWLSFWSEPSGLFKDYIERLRPPSNLRGREMYSGVIHDHLIKMGKVNRPIEWIKPQDRKLPANYQDAIIEIVEREVKKLIDTEGLHPQVTIGDFVSNLKGMKGEMDFRLFSHYLSNLDGIISLYKRLCITNVKEDNNGQVFLEE